MAPEGPAVEAALADPSPHIDPWFGIPLALGLVLLNGFFVAAEFAFVKLRPTQLQRRVEQGEFRARIAARVLDQLDSHLSACQLGITFASLVLGFVGEPVFAWMLAPIAKLIPGMTPALLDSIALTTSFLVMTALHIVVGEQAPKWIGIQAAERTALWVAVPLHVFYKISFPLTWVLNVSVNYLLRAIGIRPGNHHDVVDSEEELRLLLAQAVHGRLSEQKRELLDNVFELSHRTARQIMVPRVDVACLSLTSTLEQNLEMVRRCEFTRYPLCDGDLDHTIGLIHIKDLLLAQRPGASLQELKRELHFVPESLTLDRLLRRMLKRGEQMVALVDEYGGVSGIVTLENVIEELVGNIQDEFDRETPEIEREGKSSYRVNGQMLVADFEAAIGVEFSDRDEDTVAGVVLSELGRSPHVGDTVEIGELDFEVLETRRQTIDSLRVTRRVLTPSPGGMTS